MRGRPRTWASQSEREAESRARTITHGAARSVTDLCWHIVVPSLLSFGVTRESVVRGDFFRRSNCIKLFLKVFCTVFISVEVMLSVWL